MSQATGGTGNGITLISEIHGSTSLKYRYDKPDSDEHLSDQLQQTTKTFKDHVINYNVLVCLFLGADCFDPG